MVALAAVRRCARRRLRVLVTAGPTREYIDPVRYISNDSSGTMGFALAAAALRRGHDVTLVHGPVTLRPVRGARAVAVVSASEMLRACRRAWRACDVLVMAAAVADYAPAHPSRTKVKQSRSQRMLELAPTVDILAALSAARRGGQKVIGFALEDRAPRRNAQEKLERKGLDAIVLNRPAAIGAARSRVEILERGGRWVALPMSSKAHVAARLVALIEKLCGGHEPVGSRPLPARPTETG